MLCSHAEEGFCLLDTIFVFNTKIQWFMTIIFLNDLAKLHFKTSNLLCISPDVGYILMLQESISPG